MAENRTLKRALTDPRVLSGIGNAYSDEILHAAQLSSFGTDAQAAAAGVGAPLRCYARDHSGLDG